MKRCSAKPYEGNEKYIFVSYCHKDKAIVFPIIEQLAKDGYRIWYDEGIDPGSEWPEIIAQHLNDCSSFFAFVTNNSLNSHNCRRELNFALLKQKHFISIMLEPVNMSYGTQMQLSATQSIFKYKIDNEDEFYNKISNTSLLDICKGDKNPDIIVSSFDDYEVEPPHPVRDPFSDCWYEQDDPEKTPSDTEDDVSKEKRRLEIERLRLELEISERKRLEEEERAKREAERMEAESKLQEAQALEQKRREAEIKEKEEKLRKEKEDFEKKKYEEEIKKKKIKKVGYGILISFVSIFLGICIATFLPEFFGDNKDVSVNVSENISTTETIETTKEPTTKESTTKETTTKEITTKEISNKETTTKKTIEPTTLDPGKLYRPATDKFCNQYKRYISGHFEGQGYAKMRFGPSKSRFNVVGQIDNGNIVTVQTKSVDGWTLIYYEGVEGWVRTDFLFSTYDECFSKIVEPDEKYSGYQGYVDVYDDKGTPLNMRVGPSKNYGYITKVPDGSDVKIYGISKNNNDYIYISFNNQFGWVLSKYVFEK